MAGGDEVYQPEVLAPCELFKKCSRVGATVQVGIQDLCQSAAMVLLRSITGSLKSYTVYCARICGIIDRTRIRSDSLSAEVDYVLDAIFIVKFVAIGRGDLVFSIIRN